MNAAVVHSFDVPPCYTSFAVPLPAEGEVIIELIAAGLHPIVKALANGTHHGSTGAQPFIPGVDWGRTVAGWQVRLFRHVAQPLWDFCRARRGGAQNVPAVA